MYVYRMYKKEGSRCGARKVKAVFPVGERTERNSAGWEMRHETKTGFTIGKVGRIYIFY